MRTPCIKGDTACYLWLASRQLFAAIFILAAAGHFNSSTIASAAEHGVPMPGLLVPLSGLIALAGGLSVLFGFHARLGGCLLVLFLVPVTVMMHNFWAMTDPVSFQIQLTLFIRNLLLLAGALWIARYGAGAFSLDALMTRRVAQAA
ncbi:MAG TPA: DoxX family protein [Vicinamibacterales bacterium]|jgi:putative oxidoreductase|nr:DoxX family protein [Vicinamibacterales bacterium]